MTIDRESRCVIKHYHARYTAEDELAAYAVASDICVGISGLRTAQVLAADNNSNELCIEYIEGPTLSQHLGKHGVSGLTEEITTPILLLLAAACHRNVAIDADPSNFIIMTGGRVVLVDPVATDLGLRNAAAVIFFWGLVKYRVRYAFRLWEFPGFLRTWRSLVSSYTLSSGTHITDLYRDLSAYICEVIRWNRQESQAEGLAFRALRMVVLVPLWKGIERFFWILSQYADKPKKTR